MAAEPHNPDSNKLPPGLSEDDLLAAVESSGYPLQTFVANTLAADFNLTEEWTYIDVDSTTERTIDLHAARLLYDSDDPPPKLLPIVDLFIECKRSVLPYVFFLTDRPPDIPRFPLIAGLKAPQDVTVEVDKTSVTYRALTRVLRFHDLPFAQAPAHCLSFSRLHRKGSELELSGADPFNSIFLPITKAMRYHHKTQIPYYSSDWSYFRMVFGLCVLDAPMVAAHVNSGGLSTSLTPWVRLLRHEPQLVAQERAGGLLSTWVVDAVHRDYLRTFIDEHVLPFAEQGIRQVAADAESIFGRRSFPRARLDD